MSIIFFLMKTLSDYNPEVLFYYHNKIVQYVIIIFYLIWSIYYLRKMKREVGSGVVNRPISAIYTLFYLISDIFGVLYEIILIYGTTYF